VSRSKFAGVKIAPVGFPPVIMSPPETTCISYDSRRGGAIHSSPPLYKHRPIRNDVKRKSVVVISHSYHLPAIMVPFTMYRVVQKTDTLCFVRLNFIKHWPIFRTYFTVWISRTFVIILSPQVCHESVWNVSVLKATIENKTTSVTTHFKSASYCSKVDTLNIWTITAGCVSYFR